MEPAGHYPYQAPIDAYGNGGFRFADMSHRGGLLSLPTGMHAWPVERAEAISLADLAPVLALAGQVDVCLVGLGGDIARLPRDVRDAFKQAGIILEAVSTGAAVRTYNVLMAEHRAVAAALIAVSDNRPPRHAAR